MPLHTLSLDQPTIFETHPLTPINPPHQHSRQTHSTNPTNLPPPPPPLPPSLHTTTTTTTTPTTTTIANRSRKTNGLDFCSHPPNALPRWGWVHGEDRASWVGE